MRVLSRNSFISSTSWKEERVSHYLEEYEDQGNFIEIIRVDRLEKNRFELKVRRGGFQLKKKSESFEELYKELMIIYKGVSFVPDISFKGCNKREAKERAEGFLTKVESLPKISIN